MAKEGRDAAPGLEGIAAAAGAGKRPGAPPLDSWNPPFCGDIDLRIAADGTWLYQGSPIGRPSLVRLFASIMRKEGDRHVLVTPVEKVGIRVDDAAFVAVAMAVAEGPAGRVLSFRTNVDDVVTCDGDHPLRFVPQPGEAGTVAPYLHVRRDLWAKVARPVFYDLVALGEEREIDGAMMFGVASAGIFFPIARADSLGEVS